MITYIIQVVLFQVLFLAVYDFFLSKETFYNYNRWYLLGTPILSFILPLIKIPTFQKAVPQEIMILLPEVMLSPQKVIEKTTFYTDGSINYLNLLFWIGTLLFTIVFLIKLFKIIRLITKNETIQKHFYKLVLLPKQNNAFSFFNYIFLGKNIPAEKQESIIEHELIHASQKHTLDLLFFELLKIVTWFNPMIYFYQHRITLLHEYISDAAIIKNTEKHQYFNTLLSQTFQVENISFVNQFYKHSLIKKRIIMMTKNKSKQIKKAKYLLLLPLLASMLVYTSCETNDVLQETNSSLKKEKLPISMLKEVVVGDENRVMEVSMNDELSSTVRLFVAKNFNRELVKSTDLKSEVKIFCIFSVGKEGNIDNVSVKSDNLVLKNETLRIINSLPKLNPAMKDGAPVAMRYTLPITYNPNFGRTQNPENKFDIPLAIIENVPVFPGCEEGTRKDKMDCLNEKIRHTIIKNFNADFIKDLGLPKGRAKIWTQFRIDKKGNVVDIKVIKSPHPKLSAEALKAVKALPKMKPGLQRGKAVGVKYTLPISFNVE